MNVFVMQQMVKGQPVAVKPETVALTAGDALNKLSAQTGLNGDVLARQGWQAVQLVAVNPAVIAQAQANEAQLAQKTAALDQLDALRDDMVTEIGKLQTENTNWELQCSALRAQLAALTPAQPPAAPEVVAAPDSGPTQG